MKKILLLLAISIGISGYSQTDDNFLIKVDGDTLRGVFKYKSGEDIKTKITVKVNDTLKVTLKAAEVKYFKEGKDEYISFQPQGETGHYFVKIWVMGKYLELYEWQLPLDLSGGSKTEFIPYVRKRGEKDFLELDPGTWKKILPDLINDYEELSDAVWKGKYKLDQLGEIVTKYNEWKEDNK